VLAQDLEVTGLVKVELFANSSAVDTDFTAKLVDVWPDGFAQTSPKALSVHDTVILKSSLG